MQSPHSLSSRPGPPDYQGVRALIMGLGQFGGGAAAARFLCERGARVSISDAADAEQLGPALARLEDLPLVEVDLGQHDERLFRETELLVVNPAVHPGHRLVELARSWQATLTSEIELFWREHRGRTIAVTGSNGKSTTAALIHHLLQGARHLLHGARHTARLGGNIGISLLSEVDAIQPDDWTILELSSFQLHALAHLQPRAEITVVTGFAPNHLDWHGSLAAYRQAKQTLLRFQTATDTAVLPGDDADVRQWPGAARRLLTWDTQPAITDDAVWWQNDVVRFEADASLAIDLEGRTTLRGRHNRGNLLLAVAAAVTAGANAEHIRQRLPEFQSLPHRLEPVRVAHGVQFVNDSLATTPESVIAAVQAFPGYLVVLAGGYDKQIDLTPMAQALAEHADAVALIGQTARELDRQLAAAGSRDRPLRMSFDDFDSAFAWAAGTAAAAHDDQPRTVLLSPGCASYDWFRSFEARGTAFRRLADDWQPDNPLR